MCQTRPPAPKAAEYRSKALCAAGVSSEAFCAVSAFSPHTCAALGACIDTDDGYRVGKYEIKVGAKSLLSNDFPYFRYTEVLLMKAECLLRLGQNETEAAHIVSQIRERAFRESAHPEKATVDAAWLKGDTHINYGTLDEKGQIDDAGNTEVVELGGLYDEWGWEFAAEARRRTDMIRFGTYQKKSWFNHTPTANDLNGNSILFPIHLDHLNTNPNLQQNPGYAGK